jgi:hypothetical protein
MILCRMFDFLGMHWGVEDDGFSLGLRQHNRDLESGGINDYIICTDLRFLNLQERMQNRRVRKFE